MTDLWCIDDIDPGGAEVTGLVAIEQSVVRRLTTTKGSILMAPDDGVDLRDYIGEAIDPPTMAQLRAEILDELDKEDGILAARVLAFDAIGDTLSIALDLDTASGPLTFDLAITDVTVRIIHKEATT